MKNLITLVQALNLGQVKENGGRVYRPAEDDDINLTSIRDTGLDYSDFDGSQIPNCP